MNRGLLFGYLLLAIALAMVALSEPLMMDLRLPVAGVLLCLAVIFWVIAQSQMLATENRRLDRQVHELHRQLEEAREAMPNEPQEVALRLVRMAVPAMCDHLAPAVRGVCTRCGRPVS